MKKQPPLYQYAYATQLPTAGAMAYGFESESLAWRPMIGPAIGARYQFYSVWPTPQLVQAGMAIGLTGLTGVVAGQNTLQPLSNPYVIQ